MPTKEQILEAAGTSPEAKAALKKLFPEHFEDEKYFDLLKLRVNTENTDYFTQAVFTVGSRKDAGFPLSSNFFGVVGSGDWRGKAFHLSSYCNWEIVKLSETGQLILVPTKKES